MAYHNTMVGAALGVQVLDAIVVFVLGQTKVYPAVAQDLEVVARSEVVVDLVHDSSIRTTVAWAVVQREAAGGTDSRTGVRGVAGTSRHLA